jgi:HK97 family phage major capsid protein
MSKDRHYSPGVRAKLAAAGVTPGHVGRTFNVPGQVTNPTTPDEVKIPGTSAELEAMLGDNKTMAALLKQKDGLGNFIRAYAKVIFDQDMSIGTQVREECQRMMGAWFKEQEEQGAIPRIDLRNPADVVRQAKATNTVHNPKAMGAAIDNEFETSADYFRSIWHNTQRDASAQARIARVRNAFSSTVPSEGGFLIPETLRSELLMVALETAVVRPRARVIPMESLRVPFPAVDSTSNVNSVFGGIVGYWTEEGAALTQSSAKFSRVVLDAKKLTAYTEVPNELISDSVISFQAFIDQIFPEALGWYEDVAFLTGLGAGEPLGVFNAAATVEVAAEGAQPADTIVWENVVKMFARMLPASLSRAVWVVSPETFPELATMALSVGTGGSAVWLNNGAAGPPMTILGRPVIISEKAKRLGDAGDINFIDFGFYLIGDRQVMSAMSSPHYKFGNDMTAYRIIERLDGRPWLESAITPQNGGATLSPFVRLAAR